LDQLDPKDFQLPEEPQELQEILDQLDLQEELELLVE
jgi:hypothetical protein